MEIAAGSMTSWTELQKKLQDALNMTSWTELKKKLQDVLNASKQAKDDTKKNDCFWHMKRILERMTKAPDKEQDVNALEMLIKQLCVLVDDVIPLLWQHYADVPPEESPNKRRNTSEDWKKAIQKIVTKYNNSMNLKIQSDEDRQVRRLLLAALGLLMVHVDPTVYREIGESQQWKAAVNNREDKAFANAIEVFERGKSAALKKADEIYMEWKREQMKAQWFDDTLQTAMAKIERELQKKLEFEQFHSTKSSVLPHKEFKCEVELGEKEENKVKFKCTILFGTQRVRATVTWDRPPYVNGYDVLRFTMNDSKDTEVTKVSPLRSNLAGREDYELADTTLVKTAQLYAKEALQEMQAKYGKQRFYSFENTPGLLDELYVPRSSEISQLVTGTGTQLPEASGDLFHLQELTMDRLRKLLDET